MLLDSGDFGTWGEGDHATLLVYCNTKKDNHLVLDFEGDGDSIVTMLAGALGIVLGKASQIDTTEAKRLSSVAQQQIKRFKSLKATGSI